MCDSACLWRKKVEQRDEYKQKWDDYYSENPLPLPPGIDSPLCPRGNAMCQGTPGKPSRVISDQQDIDNRGLTGRINAGARSSGDRVNGDVSEPSKRGFFDRVATGTGTRSTRHDPAGGNTPMTVEELWQFLKENKAELGHTGLDVLGLIPIIGEIADIANAAWYAAQGDFKMAGISAASAVPFLGWGGTGAKLGVKYGDEIIDAAQATGRSDPPQIKPGSSGGPNAGKPFTRAQRRAELEENPDRCVYCRMRTDRPQIDHKTPKSRGGNTDPDNRQTTCPWCNGSKNNRDYPVNPPPGYVGPWPPPWWSR